VGTFLAEWKVASKHSYSLRRKRFCQRHEQGCVAVPACTVRKYQPGRRLCRRVKKSTYRRFAKSLVRERLCGGVDHNNNMDAIGEQELSNFESTFCRPTLNLLVDACDPAPSSADHVPM